MDDFLRTLADEIINPLIILMFTVALVVFMWGIFEYVRNSGEPTKRKEGAKNIMWGLIGFVVMVSAYAIINIALDTFGFSLP